jgi:hypothetical protein
MSAMPLNTNIDPILDIAKHLDVASEDELVLRREHIALMLDKYFSGKIKKVELIDWAEYVVGFVTEFEDGYFELLNETIHDIASMNVKGWQLSDEKLRDYREHLKVENRTNKRYSYH